MSQEALLGTLALLLLAVGVPLVVSISARTRAQRLDQPLIIFTSRSWQYKLLASLTLAGAVAGLAISAMGGAILLGGFALVSNTGAMSLLMVAGGLIVLVLGIIMASPAYLYWNYLRSVGLSSLIFGRAEQTLEYTSKNGSTRVPIAEITQLISYRTWQLRQNIGYTMLILADGRQLPVPTSLCGFDDLRTFLPGPEIKIKSCFLPILPGKSTPAYCKP